MEQTERLYKEIGLTLKTLDSLYWAEIRNRSYTVAIQIDKNISSAQLLLTEQAEALLRAIKSEKRVNTTF